MKRALLALVAFVGLTSLVWAEGLPAPKLSWGAVATQEDAKAWAGWQLGVFGGYHNDAGVGSFGGLIGYQWQQGRLVYGWEADATKLFNDEATDGDRLVQMDYYGSIRAKLGYDLGVFMPYATAGWAMGWGSGWDLEERESVGFTTSGWVYGGGIDTRIIKNVSLRAEYLHYDFDGKEIGGIGHDLSDDVFRAVVAIQLN